MRSPRASRGGEGASGLGAARSCSLRGARGLRQGRGHRVQAGCRAPTAPPGALRCRR